MIYLDSSAALKAVVAEPESDALLGWLSDLEDDVVGSWLVHTELHCAAARRPDDVDASLVDELLSRVLLVDLRRSDLLAAASDRRGLRTLDAIHLATALRVAASAMVTYDRELSTAARGVGLEVVQPSDARRST